MKLNILVTAAGSAVAQGIIKSIKLSNLDCKIVATDAQMYAAGLYRVNCAYLVPLAKSPRFIDEIIKICREEKIDAIFIGVDYELLAFSINKKRIKEETGAKVIVSDPETIKIADDKWLTHQFLVDNNILHIPSALYKDSDAFAEREGFPLIVKPRIGDSSKNTSVVNNKRELNEKIKVLLDCAEDNPYLPEKVDPMIQKYMGNEGSEFTSTTLTIEGKCVGVLSMNREMRFGGHTTRAIIEDYQDINKVIKEVATKFKTLGPANFQSRLVNDVPLIFEINCRFSGTTPFCAQVGFNTVEATIRHYILGEPIQQLNYKKGVFLRYFNEIFIPASEIDKISESKKIKNPVSYINKIF